MKVLLVYPKYPETFWSFKHALNFIGKKSAFPPLGLLTVAAMLPGNWEKRLVDMNVDGLKDRDIEWADYVFISAMIVQKDSAGEVIERCKKAGKKVVAGGPLFITNYEDFRTVDHLVIGEAEIALPLFLKDLEAGKTKRIYQSEEKTDLDRTPLPLWELINMKKYASMSIQYSRGCPFNCDFCNITLFFGRVQRVKSKEQILAELGALYTRGWRGAVFFVDDNFIGNKEKLKKEILPSLVRWRAERNYPFTFNTQASVNLSDDEELMDLMVEAGFDTVFLGIETVNEDSLTECGKYQNKNRDLVSCVKKIQRKGINVQGGFIVGFDSDSPSIFERQIQFIQKSGIATAMVGILGVLRGTKLYQRLEKEKRLFGDDVSGNNTDCSVNFMPKMGRENLVSGYKKIIGTIYSPRHYCQRVINFLKEYRPAVRKRSKFQFCYLKAFFQSIWILGIKEKIRGFYFWKLLFWTLAKQPKSFPLAITLAIQGYHFRKVFEKYL